MFVLIFFWYWFYFIKTLAIWKSSKATQIVTVVWLEWRYSKPKRKTILVNTFSETNRNICERASSTDCHRCHLDGTWKVFDNTRRIQSTPEIRFIENNGDISMWGMDLNKTNGEKNDIIRKLNVENGMWGQLYNNKLEYWRLRKYEIRVTTECWRYFVKRTENSTVWACNEETGHKSDNRMGYKCKEAGGRRRLEQDDWSNTSNSKESQVWQNRVHGREERKTRTFEELWC